MFLKKKRCGRIKGRGCADGRKQRLTTNKDDVSAPTVSTEALMLTCAIDALEERDVATVDVPAAFMQADMEGDDVNMKLEGQMVHLLAKLDPTLYRKFVIDEGGKPVLYVQLKKALYGTLQGAMLFWKNLTNTLQEWGFEINPYDWCVANKTVNGKQITIVWHVDDLKISHVDKDVVTEYITKLQERYGKEAPLTIRRGKIHDYLGMVLDYSKTGKVRIDMLQYIEALLESLPSEYNGDAVTPAAGHLLDVDEACKKLSETDAAHFHTIVAKLLFLCKRARPDLQTAVAFLTTRVKEPDEDDQRKLQRAIKYLRSTKNLTLTLEADKSGTIRWWVDAAFAVHHNMKSHTGSVMTLGKGAVYSSSTKQKLNTKSSTEAELVGLDDVMPQILWTRYFLIAQGFVVTDNIIYRDNQSSMRLEKNGRGSSGKRTRHINIRYFFVTDRINADEMSIEYCPTEMMVADFYTKPLQGKLFRLFRSIILNLDDADMKEHCERSNSPYKPKNDELQECVEKDKTKQVSFGGVRKATYADILKKGTCMLNNDTRDIVSRNTPSILHRLKCMSRKYFEGLIASQ